MSLILSLSSQYVDMSLSGRGWRLGVDLGELPPLLSQFAISVRRRRFSSIIELIIMQLQGLTSVGHPALIEINIELQTEQILNRAVRCLRV